VQEIRIITCFVKRDEMLLWLISNVGIPPFSHYIFEVCKKLEMCCWKGIQKFMLFFMKGYDIFLFASTSWMQNDILIIS
jgi:hypothetical protein